MLRFALLLVLMAGFCGSADAQWLRSKRNASVSSACPNGECPVQAAQVQSAPEVRGHWSYPGTIDSHLESVHGKSTAGMTRQQKLDYHDSLHEGTAGASAYQSVGYYCVGYGSSGRSYGSAGYGSSGRSYGSAGYGSSGRATEVPATAQAAIRRPMAQVDIGRPTVLLVAAGSWLAEETRTD